MINRNERMMKDFLTDRQVKSIPTDAVRPNPYQPRRRFSEESLEELSQSIKRYGLIQPIAVRQMPGGYYELIAGERRLRATKRAGLVTINAIVYSTGEQDTAMLALIENLQRENLHFFDEAEAYKSLLMEHGMTQEDLARKIGRNQSTVANKLRILKFTPRVKQAIIQCRLTERHARTLLRIQDEELQLSLIEQIRAQSMSVKDTEALVERTLDRLYEEEEAEHAPKRKVVGIFRDGRLLINGIRKLVDQVCNSGLNATYQTQDYGDKIEICVVVPKK